MSDTIFDITDIAQGIDQQAEHCRHNGAHITAAVVHAQLGLLEDSSLLGKAIQGWQGKILEDAMPLRVAGGLHYLHLSGQETRLQPVYKGEVSDASVIRDILLNIVRDHDKTLISWLDSPPQTNEAGRSACFMAGLKWLSAKGLPPRFDINELGASAGINVMMERYHYNLGGVVAGPSDSLMQICPEWRGAPPPNTPIEIVAIEGCDQNVIDLSDRVSALRVKSYIWPENLERLSRMDIAVTLACQKAPKLSQMDAADWVDMRLASPQEAGTTRVISHSIVWQYIPEIGRARITQALEKAGEAATAQAPIAWMRLETNRATFRHELLIRYWNGGPPVDMLLAEAQAHGAWVKWLG